MIVTECSPVFSNSFSIIPDFSPSVSYIKIFVYSSDGRKNDKSNFDYRLFQNYPNPFNSETIIKYSLLKKDNIFAFVTMVNSLTDIALNKLIGMIGISQSKYYQWNDRIGQPNYNNAAMPKINYMFDEYIKLF